MAIRDFLGFHPLLGERAYVDETALVIGRVILGEDASVWPFAVLRGDVERIEIGARTNIQDGCVLHVVHDGPYTPGGIGLTVGADVTVGHRAVLHAARIGDRCLIGMGAIVLDNAVVADEVVVGAGSVVAPGQGLAPGGLYLGNPARRVRDLGDDEIARLAYGARAYVTLKEQYRTRCG